MSFKYEYLSKSSAEGYLRDVKKHLKHYTILNANPFPGILRKGIGWPRGTYGVRDKTRKGFFHTYGQVGNPTAAGGGIWVYLGETEVRSREYCYSDTTYMTFPSIPEKEWDELRGIHNKKRISKMWQRWLCAHDFWMELRAMTRRGKLGMLRVMKKRTEEKIG